MILRIIAAAAIVAFMNFPAFAQDEDSIILKNLHRMRLKQQEEEFVMRALIFKNRDRDGRCTPVEQTRARLREAGRDKNGTDNDITINAGTGELNVTDNHGTINSDVNVQIIKQGRENPCL